MTSRPMNDDVRGRTGAAEPPRAAAGEGGRTSRLPAVLFALALGAVGYWLGRDEPAPVTQGNTQTLVDTPTVLAAIQQLARLETVAYHMERVIDVRDRQSRFFGLLRASDALLLIAAGDVVAGVDLARLRDQDVRIDAAAERVVLHVPAAQVFSAKLDNQHTYVHSRSTDLLAERDEHFETRARQLAESEIRRAAVTAGVLQEAQANAEQTLRSLLQALGFRDIQLLQQE